MLKHSKHSCLKLSAKQTYHKESIAHLLKMSWVAKIKSQGALKEAYENE